MTTQRLVNRKQRRKFRASLKKQCEVHGVTFSGHCPACSLEGYMQYLWEEISGLNDLVFKNPNRVAKGAR